MKITVIIPAFAEEKQIGKTIRHLVLHGGDHLDRILVTDGGSTDKTEKEAIDAGAEFLLSPRKGRAAQMNFAAGQAQGAILYFVHADALPPPDFATSILKAIESGAKIGGFRQRFDSSSFLLKINAWFTRFNILSFRGGDQSVFIRRDFFEQLNGYNEKYTIMEEYDLMKRAAKHSAFYLIPKSTITSARKYEKNSWLRVMLANWKAIRMFHAGKNPDEIKRYYQKKLQF